MTSRRRGPVTQVSVALQYNSILGIRVVFGDHMARKRFVMLRMG